MSNENNTPDNVEAFLFELKELQRRHKVQLQLGRFPDKCPYLKVEANGQTAHLGNSSLKLNK